MDVTFSVTEEAACHSGGLRISLLGLSSVWGSFAFQIPKEAELLFAMKVEHASFHSFSVRRGHEYVSFWHPGSLKNPFSGAGHWDYWHH
jgi:hypothetical protein